MKVWALKKDDKVLAVYGSRDRARLGLFATIADHVYDCGTAPVSRAPNPDYFTVNGTAYNIEDMVLR